MTDPILRALAGRIIPLLIITIAIISIPTLATISGPFSYQAYSLNATSTAISAGTLSVLWGDSYAPARINQGTGNETLTITGAVTPRADLP